MSRITITELSKKLGLSVCTINKAMTGKPRISEETRQRVLEAAKRFGYQPSAAARSMGRSVIKLAFIRHEFWPSHVEALFDGVRERLAELSGYRVEASFKKAGAIEDGRSFLRAVKSSVKDGVNGIVCNFGFYSSAETDAVWRALSESGIPFVALGAGVEGRDAQLSSVWHDCRLCGRLAAQVLAGALPAGSQLAIVIGEKSNLDHRLKIEGFAEELAGRGFPAPEIVEAFDDPAQAFPSVEKLLKSKPSVKGLYVGTENVEGVVELLSGTPASARPKLLATGVSKPVAEGLASGVVLASVHQRQREQGRLAVDVLFNFLEERKLPEKEILVRPQVLFPANFEYAE